MHMNSTNQLGHLENVDTFMTSTYEGLIWFFDQIDLVLMLNKK